MSWQLNFEVKKMCATYGSNISKLVLEFWGGFLQKFINFGVKSLQNSFQKFMNFGVKSLQEPCSW